MTQWDMNVIESLGLLKMDFLGLRTLTVLDDAVKIIKHLGVDLDLEEIPLDDPETFRIFSEGRTSGIFQFESRGMTDLLRRFKPSRFDELAALNALYRPGAMTLVDEYIQRKQGKKFSYLAPEMQPILEETYGIIVYQEQVMLIGVAVAGFSMAEADTLRKAMGKKKADVMAKMKEKFVDGAANRGMPRQKAAELWDKIEPFAGYGFNKSHSVAYANLAYKTAYLKAHFPVAFMAAMLNSELSSSDAIAKYISECHNMGIELLPPDVNESGYMFTVVGDKIRYGLGAIKGVGESAIESVLAARGQAGRFRSLGHLATEVDLRLVNRKVFECLVKAGAFDSLGVPRTPLWHSLDSLLDYAQRRRRDREEGQSSLFGMLGGGQSMEPAPDLSVRPWPERERLRYEKEALGLFLTGNPLSEHQATLERLITHTTANLRDPVPEGTVTLGGMIAGVSRVKIKSGANAGRFMGRFVLEDLEGSLAVTLFANQLQQFGHLLIDEAVVLVKGQVRERGSEIELTVEEIIPLDKLATRGPAGVDLTLDPALSQSKMLKLRDLLTEHPGDVPVTLEMQFPDRVVRIATEARYKIQLNPELVSSIEGLLGQGSVRERYQASGA
jgi:DNA polymerase-3 subunit alpha